MRAAAEPLMAERSAAVSAPVPAAQQTALSPRVIRAAVIGIAFLAYASTLSYQFVYDDRNQIVTSTFIKSWHFLPRYFTSHVWGYLDPTFPGNYYRPLFLVWLLLNYKLFGLNPFWWHLTNVLMHVGVTYLVFLLARRLLKDETQAAIAALIFGLHPTHIESVAWISGVTDPMLALFFIPSFLFYLRWREAKIAQSSSAEKVGIYHRPAFNLTLSLAFFMLAMLSKEVGLVLPGVVLVYELAYGQREGRWLTLIKRVIPFAAVAVVYLVMRLMVLKAMGHPSWPMPLSVMLMTIPSVLWFYIRLLIWPVGLSAFYDTPYVTHADATFWLMALGLMAVTAGLLVWARKSKPVAVAVALLVLPILPALNLPIFIEKELAHDRYLYLPSVGFAILLAAAISRLNVGKLRIVTLPTAQAGLAIALMLAFTALTLQQSVYYTTDLELFKRGVAIAPNNDIAVTNLANELFNRQRVDEAISLYETVIERNPTYWRASFNLGSCFLAKGDEQTGMKHRARAKAMDAVFNTAEGRTALVFMRFGNPEKAVAMFQRTIADHPDNPAFKYGLGIVLKEKGDLEGALAAFQSSAASSPDPLPAQTQIDELESRLNHGAPNMSASIKAP